METFQLHILGCGSALPTSRHFPTSQVINFREKLFMIDCGEGTQLQFRKSHLKFSRLNHIFISHLHGDHCFGLMGLISTLDLLGRTADLHIYSPSGLEELLTPMLNFFNRQMGFKVLFHAFSTKESEQIYEDRSLTVSTIPLKHRMPACGFLFREKQGPNHIIREMVDYYEVPTYEMNRIKNGCDYTTPEGKVIPNSVLTSPADPPRSFAYCSDTLYRPSIVPLIENVDLLFHEATFMESEAARARQTCHSTARQAASIARDANARKLVIGHFSARYDDETPLLGEAKEIFPNTLLAKENLCVDIS